MLLRNMETLERYTAEALRDLAESKPDQQLIVEYREGGVTSAGVLLSAYKSTTGRHCANVGNFANTVYCSSIRGHRFES